MRQSRHQWTCQFICVHIESWFYICMYFAHIYKQTTSIYTFTSKVICGSYLVSACMCIYVYVLTICVCMCKMFISAHICLYVPILLVYVCICVGIHKQLYVYVYVCICMYPPVSACITCMCMHLHVLVCIWLYMYVFACMSLYAYFGGDSRFHQKSSPLGGYRGVNFQCKRRIRLE